jgi:hypothetical protein
MSNHLHDLGGNFTVIAVNASFEHQESKLAPGLSVRRTRRSLQQHSATSACDARTSSMALVDKRWPATLMMSSVRAIMYT